MNLTLIRGLPGSGKSELAKVFKEFGWTHYSLNEYKTRQKEEFAYVASVNHESCHSQVMLALESGRDVVVTHNFINPDEITPYRNIASLFDLDITVIVCSGASPTYTPLPDDVLNTLRQQWRNYPGEITIDSIEQLTQALHQLTSQKDAAIA